MLLPILYFVLSLGAIYAVIPIIIIVILILAARGAATGGDLFTMFGINTLLGAQRVTNPTTNPRASGKGLAGGRYRPRTLNTAAVAQATIGQKQDKKPIFGYRKAVAGSIIYDQNQKPKYGRDKDGTLHAVDKDGNLLSDDKGKKIPILGTGFEKKVPRGIDFKGWTVAKGVLTQKTILNKDPEIWEAIMRTKGKQDDTPLGIHTAMLIRDAEDSKFMLGKLNTAQLDAAVMHYNNNISAADLANMSQKEKMETIMKSTDFNNLKTYMASMNISSGTPPPLAAPYSNGLGTTLGAVKGFYKSYGPARRQRTKASYAVDVNKGVLNTLTDKQLTELEAIYNVTGLGRQEIIDKLARRLSNDEIKKAINKIRGIP